MMGMYDEIKCEYELPLPEYQGRTFQTKDTPAQALELYVIKADGSLWQEIYDLEDRSDPNATGWKKFVGCTTRVNKRFEECIFSGEIYFCDFPDGFCNCEDRDNGWIEFCADFTNGKLETIRVAKNKPASMPRNHKGCEG